MKSLVDYDSSLERLVGLLEAHNPSLYALLSASSEEQFIAATESALEYAIVTIESGAKRYKALDERGLSRLLADLLTAAGYRAAAERDVNGHVDVVIEHAFGGRWKYLGECKIHGGFEYHIAGCSQVLSYCTGREKRTFALDFFKAPRMLQKLLGVRRRMDDERPLQQADASADHSIKGAFVTAHDHRVGGTVEVLHVGCSLAGSGVAGGGSDGAD